MKMESIEFKILVRLGGIVGEIFNTIGRLSDELEDENYR